MALTKTQINNVGGAIEFDSAAVTVAAGTRTGA